jgi:hypothetical protein
MFAALFVFSAPPAAAQTPTQQPQTSFTFGQAKAHNPHTAWTVEGGAYCGRWLITDPTNNGGNNFLGNVVCFDHWLYGPTWLYFDWSANASASTMKIATWREGQTWINVVFDDECKLATFADTSSPYYSSALSPPARQLAGVITGDRWGPPLPAALSRRLKVPDPPAERR